ncbi:MAG: peptidoglycan-binding protein, partial [Candidatus Paceibacterota bacterium]
MSTKKFGIVAGIALALSVVISPVAACSLQDLSSCDNNGLMALIAQMLSGSTTTTTTTTTGTGTISGIPAGFQFTTNLKQGSTGEDVKYLQILLNSDPVTSLQNAGRETTYFGAMTKAAVIKFQAKYASEVLAPYGLTAGTGFFGTSSRAKANAILSSSTGYTFPAGCTSSSGFSTTTGQSCSGSGVTLPAGCTSTSGYSPTTGQ